MNPTPPEVNKQPDRPRKASHPPLRKVASPSTGRAGVRLRSQSQAHTRRRAAGMPQTNNPQTPDEAADPLPRKAATTNLRERPPPAAPRTRPASPAATTAAHRQLAYPTRPPKTPPDSAARPPNPARQSQANHP